MIQPYYADPLLAFYHGDVIDTLRQLPDESVQCVVTSPPYFALRDYGTATWVGGDAECDHSDPKARRPDERRASTLGGGVATVAAQDAAGRVRQVCGKCGAQREDKQLGLEPTPAEYVAKMVAVFDEVRRVLRDDGTCWLNLGDSYASSTGNKTITPQTAYTTGRASGNPWGAPSKTLGYESANAGYKDFADLKPKDLVGIPWRVAFALQDAGWWLRSEVTWCKRAPMPESVTDRPTSATEKIFLLTKQAKYFYDSEAVKVPSVSDHPSGNGFKRDARLSYMDGNGARGNDQQWQVTSTRNLWNYWLLSPSPYPDAHFATFPPAIPRTAILAGTSERGACPECGAPWRRVVEREVSGQRHISPKDDNPNRNDGPGESTSRLHSQYFDYRVANEDWQPTCDCDAGDPVPCVVLDPFLGSGTTALVAQNLGRKCIGIDLNSDYLDLAIKRTAQKTLWGLEAAS